MRQNNQNKRVRGRSRKGPNTLSRSYESNGPDVKIRGTAMHVAEKYVQLARDAQASGDRVIAENYLQHAEHYFRIIAAAQTPNPQQTAPREETRDGEQPAAAQTNTERRNGGAGGAVMPADAPQPFVDSMPIVNSKGQNGAGDTAKQAPEATGDAAPTKETAETSEASEEAADKEPVGPDNEDGDVTSEATEEEAPKPRRRVRGTRGRGTRRTTSDAKKKDDAEAVASEEPAPVDAPEAPASDEEVTVSEA